MKITSISFAIFASITLLSSLPQVKAQAEVNQNNQNNAIQLLNQATKKADGGDLQSAIAIFNQTIKLSPRYSLAYYNRAITYEELGDRKAALNDYNKAIQINQNWGKGAVTSAYINRGKLHHEMGNYQGAIADFNQALKLKAEESDIFYNRGLAYYKLGNKKAAFSNYSKAIQINKWQDKGGYAALLNRGVVRLDIGDHKGALSDYTQAIRLKPDYALAYKNRGLLYLDIGNQPLAVKDFQKANELYKKQKNPAKQQEIAQILREMKNP
jgi:tetratricopeptide (TPR) repeat protein